MNGGETPNLVLKKMLELLLKIPPFKKILLTKINSIIENLKDERYQLGHKEGKVLNFVLRLGSSWRAKNTPKLSSKCLNDRICKTKHYLIDMLKIINQNILAILRRTLNLQKKLSIPKETAT